MTPREASSAAKQILALFPDLARTGGVQEAGRQTAAALTQIARENGSSLHILALNDPTGEQNLRVAGCEIKYRGFARRKIAFASQAMKIALRGTSLVIAAHPNLAPPAVLPKFFRAGLKVIVMAHGFEVWKPLPPIRRYALRSADGVTVPSSDTAQKVASVQGVAREKIHRLPWPVSAEILEFATSPSALSPPQDFPRGRVILTVGRWDASERYKGVDELIGALALLRPSFPDLFLVAVGQGSDLPRLRKFASDLGVAHSVRFLENLSRAELAACYAHAGIFALPSAGEGFGLVFLEAMAFARPVVGAACGGTTDLVQDGVNGLLVPPAHVPALVQALERLLRDEKLREELGRRGAEMVRTNFRFENFQEILRSILGSSLRQ